MQEQKKYEKRGVTVCPPPPPPPPFDIFALVPYFARIESSYLVQLVRAHLLRMVMNTFLSTQSIDSARLEGKGQPKFTTGRWNPHHSGSQIATANDATVRGWDVRTMRLVFTVTLQMSTGL